MYCKWTLAAGQTSRGNPLVLEVEGKHVCLAESDWVCRLCRSYCAGCSRGACDGCVGWLCSVWILWHFLVNLTFKLVSSPLFFKANTFPPGAYEQARLNRQDFHFGAGVSCYTYVIPAEEGEPAVSLCVTGLFHCLVCIIDAYLLRFPCSVLCYAFDLLGGSAASAPGMTVLVFWLACLNGALEPFAMGCVDLKICMGTECQIRK